MTPEDLVEIELIKRLKYRYCRLLDQKRFDELETLFTEDATATYGGGALPFDDRAGIMTFLRDALGSENMLTSHLVSHPEIDLVGPSEATGVWALRDVVIHGDFNIDIRGASFYEDRYVKVDGTWLIRHTGYRRVYEEIQPRSADIKLTASWWGTDGRSSAV